MTRGATTTDGFSTATRAVNTIRRPSCDQTGGPVTPPGTSVSANGSPPSSGSNQTWAPCPRLEIKASLRPSGDQRGCELAQVGAVRRRGVPPAEKTNQMEDRT